LNEVFLLLGPKGGHFSTWWYDKASKKEIDWRTQPPATTGPISKARNPTEKNHFLSFQTFGGSLEHLLVALFMYFRHDLVKTQAVVTISKLGDKLVTKFGLLSYKLEICDSTLCHITLTALLTISPHLL
jgi:hypothetical protein